MSAIGLAIGTTGDGMKAAAAQSIAIVRAQMVAKTFSVEGWWIADVEASLHARLDRMTKDFKRQLADVEQRAYHAGYCAALERKDES